MGGRCVRPTARNRTKPSCRRPVWLTISYTLASAATVTFTLRLKTTGREAKGTCVAPTQRNRRDRPCRRLTIVPARIVRASRAGTNRFTFAGVIGGHRLAPGTYALTGTPRGGRSRSARFQIGS